MERLTRKNWRNLDPWETCGQDNYCKRGCHEQGGCTKGCIVPRIYARLAAYEETGLEPEDIKKREAAYNECLTRTYGPFKQKISQWLQAEQDGRLVVLPCKVGDTVYVTGECRIMECFIDEAYLDDRKGIEYLVSFDCDNNCEGCPFNDWHQEYSGEYSCNGEWGQASIKGSDIGKTVFLTREEAEAALAGKGISE